MISNFIRAFLAAVAVSVCAPAAHSEPAILAKARAFIGSDAALDAVGSVHYVGTLLSTHPTDPSKSMSAQVDIVFQKPHRQRITISYPKATEQTGLDGYDAWRRQQDPGDTSRWKQVLLSPDQIKRLRANTLENLLFFRGLERLGGKIEDLGAVSLDGADCRKIAFVHGPNIVFTRYFETATGRLILTETESGGSIREEGETLVNGVRFPRKIVTVTKAPGGETQTVTINLEKIVVNEIFPASFFAVPSLSPQ